MPGPEDLVIETFLPTFEFETKFDAVGFHRWFCGVWPWCFVFSAAYVLLVFGGRRLMRDREPFRLRLPLVLWNVGLSVFSFLGAVRTCTALVYMVRKWGFQFSVCDPLVLTSPVSGFWVVVCGISKVVEFGDTIFIVLRKQPLTLLHWYHHMSVCLFTWYGAAYQVVSGGYFAAMNYTVHTVMYTYFAIRAAGVRLPKKLSMAITVLQTGQMVGGLYISAYAHLTYRSGVPCSWSDLTTFLCFLMYGGYLALFLEFFFKSYVLNTPKPKKE